MLLRQSREPDSYPASLIARERELDLLGRLLERAREGTGGVALVTGEAGVGKTALIEALAREAVARKVVILAGDCYDQTTTPPYGPWRELVARHRMRQGAAVAESSASSEDPFLGQARDRSALMDQVVRFFADLAQSGPLLLVLEDLHWADEASIDLLRVVSRRLDMLPVLIVGSYRPSHAGGLTEIERAAPLLVREAQAEVVRLKPFDRPALEALILRRYTLSDTDLPRLIDYLDSRSRGNPFIALELLRNLEEERMLKLEDTNWTLGDLENVAVPRLLREMIVARLERLPADARQRLQVASVIGQDIDLDVWRRVADVSEEEMLETVDALAAAHLVTLASDGAAMRLGHALIHEAVYESISPPRRRLLHRHIGEAMERLAGTDPDQIARHYQQAGDERAANWLIRAGERAQRSYAWTAAADRLVEADRLLGDGYDARQRGWLRYRIGRLRRHADPADARRWLELAERLGAVAGDPALVAFARFDRGHIEVLGGDYRHGLQRMTEADLLLETLAPDQFTDEIAVRVFDTISQDVPLTSSEWLPALDNPSDGRRGTLVQWLAEAGRLDEAIELGTRLVDRLGNVTLLDDQRTSSLGDAWFGLGRAAAQRGDTGRALEYLDHALDCYRRIDHHLLRASTLRVLLAEVLSPFHTPDIDERLRIAREAEEAYRRSGGAANDSLVSGFASLEQMILGGQWPAAFELLQSMIDQPGGIAVWRHRAAALLARLEYEHGSSVLARKHIEIVLPDGPETEPGSTTYVRAIELQLLSIEIALDAGDLDTATIWIDTLDRWLAWSGAERGRAEARLARAACLAAAGEQDGARELAVEALDLASRPRQPLVIAAIHRFLGQLSGEDGDLDAALERLGEALAISEACHAPVEIALTKLALAEQRLAASRGDEAAQLLDESRRLFERLGASRCLVRVSELAGRIDGSSMPGERPFGLSPREVEVLRLVVAGMTDAQVADELHISYRTVTTHLTSIFTKLGVNSRVSATRIAVENDLVS